MRIVQKYGGTSLADVGKLRLAARRLAGQRLTIEDIRASLEGLDGLETLYRALL